MKMSQDVLRSQIAEHPTTCCSSFRTGVRLRSLLFQWSAARPIGRPKVLLFLVRTVSLASEVVFVLSLFTNSSCGLLPYLRRYHRAASFSLNSVTLRSITPPTVF